MARKPTWWMYYQCCEVMESATPLDPCWACGVEYGVKYWVEYGEVPMKEHPYRETTSKICMSFEKVKKEFLKCAHP